MLLMSRIMLAILLTSALALLGAIPPNHAKGFWHGQPLLCSGSTLSVPAAASSYGFNTCQFAVQFTDLTRVDVNNTKSCSSNYAFFAQTTWPNAFLGDAPTPAGNMSINANGMGLLASTNTDNVSLTSAVSTGGTNYCGYVLNGAAGAFIDIVASLNSSVEGNPHSSLWMFPVEGVAFGMVPVVEDDVLEVLDSSGNQLSNLHQWNSASVQYQLNSGCQLFGTGVDTNLHEYGKAIIPAAINGGIGLRQSWLDGVHKTAADVSYSSSTVSSCAQSGSPTGVYSVGDSEHFLIILGGPFIAIKSVSVWVAP
jgi:hypothetical protein